VPAVDGEWHPAFSSVADLLAAQTLEANGGGGALAVYHRGDKVVDIWAGARDPEGTPWTEDTLALSWSTTKGVLATAVAMAVDRGLLDYDQPVATWWPEFASRGKEEILLRHVLAHEAGLFRLRHLVGDATELNDWDHMVGLLAGDRPVHPAGAANGYHALSFAWLAGEPLRRTTGSSVGAFVREEIAAPLGLDGLFIGLPDDQLTRLARPVTPSGGTPSDGITGISAPSSPPISAPDGDDPFPLEFRPQNGIDAIAVPGLLDRYDDPTYVAFAQAEIPSANGCFTARSLARLYAALAGGGELDGTRLLSSETLTRATTQQNDRPDLVLGLPPGWRLGWHMPFTATGVLFDGFGHFGFGGSGCWADPGRNLVLAYTTNRVGSGAALGDQRLPQLGDAVVAAADARP
jgi:CubicO group peptidase (beta-lactamase class C family)